MKIKNFLKAQDEIKFFRTFQLKLYEKFAFLEF